MTHFQRDTIVKLKWKRDYVRKRWWKRDLDFEQTDPPTIDSFVANPTFVDQNNLPAVGSRNIRFSWSITSDTNVQVRFLSEGTAVSFVGDTNKSGAISQPFPSNTRDYTLEVKNSTGTVNQHIVIPVYEDPVITALGARNAAVGAFGGVNVEIYWTVSGKPFPTLSIDNNIGEISERHTNQTTGQGSIRHRFPSAGSKTITMTATNRQHNNAPASVSRTETFNI